MYCVFILILNNIPIFLHWFVINNPHSVQSTVSKQLANIVTHCEEGQATTQQNPYCLLFNSVTLFTLREKRD